MRHRLILSAAILLVNGHRDRPDSTTPHTAAGRGAAPAEPAVPSLGSIDFGARITGTDGDAARYERYRDLRDGVSSFFQIGKDTPSYFFDASASNVGYHDQRYELDIRPARMNFDFPSTPSDQLQLRSVSPWTVNDSGVLTISPALRQQVQNRTAVGVPCAPGGAPARAATRRRLPQALRTGRSTTRNLSGSISRRGATRRPSGSCTRPRETRT